MPSNLAYITYRILGGVTGRLPPVAGYWLASRVGRLMYHLSPGLRRTVGHNIRHVLGPDAQEEQVQALVRQACVHMIKGHFDLFRLRRLTREQIRAMLHIEGEENLDQALAQGRGAIVISAHLGNVEIAMQLPLIYGVPMTAAIQHIQPERLFRYVLSLRQSHGLRFIPSDEPMIGLFRALKRGELICLPCDRDIADSGRVIDFFGSPTRLSDGALWVAQRTRAPVIPAFATCLADGTFALQIEPALHLPHTGDREADVAAWMKIVVAVMERHIAMHPEQWLVAAPVWPMDTSSTDRG